MTSTPLGRTPPSRTLRPIVGGRAWERALATGALTAPVCVVVLLLAAHGGRMVFAITLVASCAAVVAASVAIIGGSRIDLMPTGLRSRRFDGDRTITTAQVARVAIRRIRNSDEVSSHRDLFLLDGDGTGLLRLSDRWWTDAQIAAIADHFPVPVESVDEPVGLAELRRVAPEQLRWRERNPWLSTAVFAVLASTGGLALAWLGVAAV